MNESLYVIWWKFGHYHKGIEGDTWYPNPVKCHQTTMLSEIFPEPEWIYIRDFSELPKDTGAIVIVSGGAFLTIPQHNWVIDAIPMLQAHIMALPWVVIVCCYDSESAFQVDQLKHDNMKIWIQEPKPGPGVALEGRIPAIGMLNHHCYRHIPVGHTRSAIEFLPGFQREIEEKPWAWFFAGRVNDEGRLAWTDAIRALPGASGAILVKDGRGTFCPQIRHADNSMTSILTTREYMRGFALAKVIPCRPAPCTPETARIYDALEAGCVPIVPCVAGNEGWNIRYDYREYWTYVFGEQPPFPVISGPEELAGAMKETLDNWPERSKIVSSWWTNYKIRLAAELRQEVETLENLQ